MNLLLLAEIRDSHRPSYRSNLGESPAKPGAYLKELWQEGGTEWIQNDEMMREKIEYVHQNPVKRG